MRTGNHRIDVRAGESRPGAMPGDLRGDSDVHIGSDASVERMSGGPRWVLALAVVLVVTLAAVVAAAVAMRRGPGDLVRGVAPAAVVPAAPALLSLTVIAPDAAVVGELARFSVTWSDGSGIFSGSTEDWGDGLATSSRKQGRCGPEEESPSAAGGTYEVGHVWSEPGTYSVVLGAATSVCEDGVPVGEEAATTLTVTVRAGANG